MNLDTIIGVCLVVFAVGLLIGLVLWSRRTINHIDQTGPRSARKILRDLSRDKAGENSGR